MGRFCAQPSELSLAERWYDHTALDDLLGVPLKINDSRLYRGLDALRPHKDALFLQGGRVRRHGSRRDATDVCVVAATGDEVCRCRWARR